MKRKVLATEWIPEVCVNAFKDEFDIIYPSRAKVTFSREEILDRIGNADVLLLIFAKADSSIIDAGNNLKVISTLSVGFDNIDVEYATRKNIAVINTPNSVTEATSEYTIALMLAIMRNILYFDRSVKAGKWEQSTFSNKGIELFGRSLGIVGFGRIGKSVGQKAQALGMSVKYYDPLRLSEESEIDYGVEYLTIDKIFSECDCVSLHLPYTKETYHLVDKKYFSIMKTNSFLVNASRGPIVKESDLVDALNRGPLKGAAIDVFEFEPKVSDELRSCKNVILSPHIGTQTFQVRINMMTEVLTGTLSLLRGKKPYNLVNKDIKIYQAKN